MHTTKKRRIALAGVTQFFFPENASVVCFISVVRVCPKKKSRVSARPFLPKILIQSDPHLNGLKYLSINCGLFCISMIRSCRMLSA